MEPSSLSEDISIAPKSVRRKDKRGKLENARDRNALVTLRRLKIQERLLETAATKALEDEQLKIQLHVLSMKRSKDFDELKKIFHSAKSLFEKLKYNVTSVERVSVKDVEDYKKIALELDEKIMTFKKFLERELHELRGKETELNTEIQEAEQNMNELNAKLVVTPYTQIVPSSVKSLRNTPSACSEVQKFQAFLESSGGHRGSWGDQEHTIFVAQWKQLFKSAPASADGGEAPYLEQLIAALVERIPGLTGEEVARHERWYREYVRLKNEQQAALDEWRRSRMLLKQLHGSVENLQGTTFGGKVKYTEKPKLAPGNPKPFAMKEIEIEAKRLEHRIEELKENLPKKNKEDICCVEVVANKLEEKTITSAASNVNKTERPCRQMKAKQSIERGVIDSWKSGRNDAKLILSSLKHGQKEKAIPTATATARSAGEAHYAAPTKLWTLKKSQGSSGDVTTDDFRLHIPMANSPKLRVSDWRRCLIGEAHR